MTGDNVLMHVDATVCWQIDDVKLCAEKAAETMHQQTNDKTKTENTVNTIKKLRSDVLKQAEASLSALIGKVNFSDTFAAATIMQTGIAPTPVVMGMEAAATPSVPPAHETDNLLFNVDKLNDAVTHANDMTKRYGGQSHEP